MVTIKEIKDKDLKGKITVDVMGSLPEWFNPPESITEKAVIHRDFPFFAAYENDVCIGFAALKIHNKYTADIYNIGVLREYQYSSPEVIKRAAALYSNVKFVCCHCCYPRLAECFERLAEFENVYFDLSSTADDPAIYNEIKSAVENAFRNIPERIIFGSDFASCNQRTHIEFFMGLDISANEKELIFHKNAEKILSAAKA